MANTTFHQIKYIVVGFKKLIKVTSIFFKSLTKSKMDIKYINNAIIKNWPHFKFLLFFHWHNKLFNYVEVKLLILLTIKYQTT